MNLVSLRQARDIISRNNGRSVSKATAQRWARLGILPTQRIGSQYVVDRDDAENFVIADQVRRVGNPGYPRPKCQCFTPGQRRCLKTARWVLGLEFAETEDLTVLRCDEHKERLMSNAETGRFKVVSVDELPRQKGEIK